MKTAVEIFQSRYRAGADGWMEQESVLECMKEYATQVTEQTLKEASKRVKIIKTGNSGSYFDASVDKTLIINTPIITP